MGLCAQCLHRQRRSGDHDRAAQIQARARLPLYLQQRVEENADHRPPEPDVRLAAIGALVPSLSLHGDDTRDGELRLERGQGQRARGQKRPLHQRGAVRLYSI